MILYHLKYKYDSDGKTFRLSNNAHTYTQTHTHRQSVKFIVSSFHTKMDPHKCVQLFCGRDIALYCTKQIMTHRRYIHCDNQ